jgi:hypothetical protein
MDEVGGAGGAGPLGAPPEAGRVREPDGSPGHKCKADGCECWVHDEVNGTKRCQPGCPGSTAKARCCNNGVCGTRGVGAATVASG